MNKEDAHIVIAMANHNMNVTDVVRAIFAHRNTVLYHLNKVKQQTGLDPRRFYDLVELVRMAQEVLESGS
jgi:carbohydrate diacid regulator